MKLNPEQVDDMLVVIRDELFVVAAVLAALTEAAGSHFEGREEESFALTCAANGKVDEILAGIAGVLAICDQRPASGRAAA